MLYLQDWTSILSPPLSRLSIHVSFLKLIAKSSLVLSLSSFVVAFSILETISILKSSARSYFSDNLIILLASQPSASALCTPISSIL